MGERGYSKDHRPDLMQMIVGVVIDAAGRPVCSEMWPGNTADVSVLVPVIDRLRSRFAIGRVCVVADRGMISAPTIAALEERGLEYVLGARERTDSLVRTVVLADQRPFTPLCIPRAGGAETQLFVKEVQAEGRRYIVCRNEAEAAKDAADRQAIVAALDQQLKRGDKALIGNSAYRRYLRATSKKAFEIDPGKLAEEARYDGVFVLRTNARITPLQAVLRYRDLIQVEQLFRTAKALMRTRPIYHSSDAAIRGHVFCSFLALILRKELDERCRKAGLRPEWGDVLRDLDRLQEVAITKDGRADNPAHARHRPHRPAVQGRSHCPAAQRPRRQRSLISPPRTIPCDANNRVRRRKLLAHNDVSKAGVQDESRRVMRTPMQMVSRVRRNLI